MKTEGLVKETAERLRRDAVPGRAEHEKAYLKSDLQHIGTPVPKCRAMASALAAEHPELIDEPWPFVTACWAAGVYELRATASYLLERVAPEALDVDRIIDLVRHSHTWSIVDELAIKVLPRLSLDALPAEDWGQDDDVWVRRTAILVFLTDLRTGGTSWRRWQSIAVPLLDDESVWIRKAIGWVLREGGKVAPARVVQFVQAHKAQMSPLTLREATRRLPADVRSRL